MSTKIEVKTSYPPMAFLYESCKPVIEINGEVHKERWGTAEFEVEPGDYTVKVYTKYFFWRKCGANKISFKVQRGESKRVEFVMPQLTFLKGNIKLIK